MPVDIAMTYICCYDTFRFNNITCRFDFFNCRLQIIIAEKTLYHNPSRTNTLFTDKVAMWNKKKSLVILIILIKTTLNYQKHWNHHWLRFMVHKFLKPDRNIRSKANKKRQKKKKKQLSYVTEYLVK